MALSRIKTNSIANDAVTSTKIAPNTVVASDIAALSIDSTKLASSAVTISKVDSTVTQLFGMRNRIINGDMRIAQRGTSAFAIDNGNWYYAADRLAAYQSVASSKFSVQQNYNSITPPTGFKNYVGAYTTTAYTPTGGDWFPIRQTIEGYNVADLDFGTANAKSVTASFWVRSSITGTHGGSFYNNDGTRTYPFTYTISSANAWEYKTITIPGDTSGTWNTTNGGGFSITFSMGAGPTYIGTAGSWTSGFYTTATGAVNLVSTLGATWYITGLQIEKGTVATEFDYRSFGTELALCQRYYEKSYDYSTAPGTSNTLNQAIGLGIYTNTPASYNRFGQVYFKVPKVVGPTVTLYAPATGSSTASANATSGDGGTNIGYVVSNQANTSGFNIAASVGGSTVTNYYTGFFAYTANSEL